MALKTNICGEELEWAAQGGGGVTVLQVQRCTWGHSLVVWWCWVEIGLGDVSGLSSPNDSMILWFCLRRLNLVGSVHSLR